MKITFAFLAAFIGLSSYLPSGDGEPSAKFEIMTKRDTDKVEVKIEKDKTVFNVHSPFGISQAVIERTDDKWPDAVVLRLHLKGLECFRASNGKVTLDAAVSSTDDKQRVRLWKDGDEKSLLDSKSPLWMEIRIVGSDGKPAKSIPLKDGYFEMQVPKAFFEGNPKSITLTSTGIDGASMNLTVDVISDVICPWCFIGKRRLEKAIAALDGQVQVRWHPFQLNPTMPREGINRQEYRTKKFGSWERSLELDANIVAVGKEEGIQFAFDRMERTPNTLDAHRLIWLADREGVQDAVVEALFMAYFTDNRDIGNRQTLIDVAAEAGLDRQRAEAVLNSEEGMDVIKEAGEQRRRFRVNGVPFFVVNGEITLSGAQPPDAFLAAFNQAHGST